MGRASSTATVAGRCGGLAPPVGRPLPGLRGVEHARAPGARARLDRGPGRRPRCARRRRRARSPSPWPRSTRPVGPTRSRPGWPRSTGCWPGGCVAGSVTLLFGEPGVGKSTLLLQVLASAAAPRGAGACWCRPRSRPPRCGPGPRGWGRCPPSLLVSCHRRCRRGRGGGARPLGPELVVVDSIQTVPIPGRRQPRARWPRSGPASTAWSGWPRSRRSAVVLVGHVTKDGELAGPRALEHLVDTVLSFEGDRHHALRLLRAVKHRFGPTGEVGLFEMGDGGLVAVDDPGALLLGDRRPEVPGSAVTALLQGRRRSLVELQALAAGAGRRAGRPARSVQGVDPRRLALLLAVLECPGGRRPRCDSRSSSRPPAASGPPSRRPTSRWPWPWPRPWPAVALPERPGVLRRGRAGRRDAPGPRGRPPAGRGGPPGLHPGARARHRPPDGPGAAWPWSGCARSPRPWPPLPRPGARAGIGRPPATPAVRP